MRTFVVGAVVIAALGACSSSNDSSSSSGSTGSSSTSSSGSTSGTSAGTTTGTSAGTTGSVGVGDWENYSPIIQLRVASFPNVCAVRQSGNDKANATQLEVDFELASGATSIAPGTFNIVASEAVGSATAELKTWDATCTKTTAHATSGSITLTSALGVTGNSVAGSYSMSLDDGTTTSGQFSVDYCDETLITGTSGCQQ